MAVSPTIMGILNVTPDSFSDGGRYASPEAALRAADRMIREGADIIDVGGESTRPGAQPVPPGEELTRVLPVIQALRRMHPTIPISIDTTKAAVATAAIAVGATMVNDISAGCLDPAMLITVAEAKVDYVMMHMQGTPRTMQHAPQYADVVSEVRAFLAARIEAAAAAGIARERMTIDPGLGFGKTAAHNISLIQRLRALCDLGCPILVGISRKSLIGHLLGNVPPNKLSSPQGRGMTRQRLLDAPQAAGHQTPASTASVRGKAPSGFAGGGGRREPPMIERIEGGLAVMAHLADQGASIFRVHDVAATRRFFTVWTQTHP